MAKLNILVPDLTTNFIKNPSVRFDTTGHTAVGSTITRSLERARSGIASLKIVTNGSTIYEGSYYRVNDLQGISDAITVSVYVRGSGKVRIRLIDNPNGKQWVSKPIAITDTSWYRLSVSGYTTGSNDVRLYVESANATPKAVTIYADAFQMERKTYPTTYCDGDQEGCQWTGLFHNSTSIRRGDTRAGGKWSSLNEDPDLYFTTIGGLGVASIRNNIQPYADAPGSYYQNAKTMDRLVTILFHTKHKNYPTRLGKDPDLGKLHNLRQSLYELLKPDKTAGDEEFTLEYTDGEFPVYFRARYDGGMEGDWDVRNQFINSFPVRFLIVSPYISNDSYEAAPLSFRDRSTMNYVMQRFDGAWRTMNGGMNAQVRQFAIGKRGEIYAVGDFTLSNNLTTAIDPQIPSNRIAYWDGIQWQKLSSGANGIIRGIAVAPNGYVYVTGDFTSIGGVSCSRVAYWNGSAWNAMSTGLNASGNAIAISSNGEVYVGGDFSTAGGVTARCIAIWNGSSWRSLGTEGGLNNSVYTIAISQDGTQVFVGGIFTDEFGSPGNFSLNYVGEYSPVTNQFSDMGDGFDNAVRKIVVAESGKVYAGGDFTETGSLTPDTMLHIAQWNGSAWFALGIGSDSGVYDIDVAKDETVIAVGAFRNIGGVEVDFCALWNGSEWVGLDISLKATAIAVLRDQYGNIFITHNTTVADYSKQTTVNNLGTAEVSPKLYLKGPCTLRWLENQTSKKRIYINLDVLVDEEIFFDLAHGKIESTVQGNVAYSVQSGSDVRSWTLMPGSNVISAFISTDIGAVFQMYYPPRFWSADSTVPVRDL